MYPIGQPKEYGGAQILLLHRRHAGGDKESRYLENGDSVLKDVARVPLSPFWVLDYDTVMHHLLQARGFVMIPAEPVARCVYRLRPYSDDSLASSLDPSLIGDSSNASVIACFSVRARPSAQAAAKVASSSKVRAAATPRW